MTLNKTRDESVEQVSILKCLLDVEWRVSSSDETARVRRAGERKDADDDVLRRDASKSMPM
jgi:hypothetical protein